MKCRFCKTYEMMQKHADKNAKPEEIMGISIVEAICMKGIILDKKTYGIIQPGYCPVCGKRLRRRRKEANPE